MSDHNSKRPAARPSYSFCAGLKSSLHFLEGPTRLQRRHVQLRLRLIFQPDAFDVPHHADYRPPPTSIGEQALADRVFSGEVTLRHRFVDDYDWQGAWPILRPEFASLPQWNAHCPEVAWADSGKESRRTGIIGHGVVWLRLEVKFPFDGDRTAVAAEATERLAISHTDALNARQRRQTFVEPCDERQHLRLAISGSREFKL